MTLYELFDYFYQANKLAGNDYPFAEVLTQLFKTVGMHKMTTLCMNLPDGIGDDASHVYFIEEFEQLFADCENVSLINVSLLQEEKLKLGKLIRQGKIQDNSIYVFDENQDWDGFQENIIIPTARSEIASKDASIQTIFLESDFLFNVALDFKAFLPKTKNSSSTYKDQCSFPIYYSLPRTSFIESWLQYGWTNHQKKLYPNDSPLFSQFAMGTGQNAMGIRFIDKIVDAVKLDEESVLLSLEHCKLVKHIKKSDPEILPANAFALGYLQNMEASLGFVRLLAATTEKNHLNVFVNMNHFKDIKTNDEFKNCLSSSGFTRIEFETDQGFDELVISNTAVEKCVRLASFNGLSEEEKYGWHGLAEAVAASGDTSFSEVCSTGVVNGKPPALPFIQNMLTMPGTLHHLITQELMVLEKASNTSHPELKHYLDLTTQACNGAYQTPSFRPDYSQYLPYVKNNKDKIRSSWATFCRHLYVNCNVQTHFAELIVRYAFYHLLKHDKVTKCLELAKCLKPEAFKNESLLHMAVKLNKLRAVAKILEENLCDINQTHSFNEYTALHMAAYNGNLDITQCLLNHHADVSMEARCDVFAIDIAMIKSPPNSDIVKLLADKPNPKINKINSQDCSSLYGSGGYNNCTILGRALYLGHTTIVPTLLKHGADKTIVGQKGLFSIYPFDIALNCNYPHRIVKLLLDETVINNMRKIIHYAQYGFLVRMRLLLENNADPNVEDENGCSALYFAIRKNFVLMAKLLIKHGAKFTELMDNEFTAIPEYRLLYQQLKGFASHAETIPLHFPWFSSPNLGVCNSNDESEAELNIRPPQPGCAIS